MDTMERVHLLSVKTDSEIEVRKLMHLCVIVCHRVSLCVTVCHCVSLCVTVCHCVSQTLRLRYVHSQATPNVSPHTYMYMVESMFSLDSSCVCRSVHVLCVTLCHHVSLCVIMCHRVSLYVCQCVSLCVTACHRL